MIPVIHDWSTCSGSDNPYLAPEVAGVAIQGRAFGMPDHKEGGGIRTSRIVTVEGRVVTTRSGSKYRLGRISPEFRKWLREQGREYDPRNPIKVRP